ncbi:MAG: ABC transporter permease [Lachnospiraceae bacterium]|nr:ABC transporter permease [Lachnospiraceae bacterium]
MLLQAMKAENLKLKGNPVWIAFLILPALSALIGTLNFTYNQGVLSNTWNSLWSQHTLFLCYFFLPPLIGTYCAYLWRMEYFNRNLNFYMTVPIPRTYLLLSKLFTATKMVCLSIAWIFFLFVVCGKIAHITEPLPISLVEWFLCGLLGGLAICSLQLLLSMIIRSFSIPIGISLLGGILGLMFTTKGYMLYWPYALLSYGMRANKPGMQIELFPFVVSNCMFIIVFMVLSALILTHRDVNA